MKSKDIIAICLGVLFFSSCITQKKKLAIFKEVGNENKFELSKLCAVHFPVGIKFVEGETIIRNDTSYVDVPGVQVECPDGTKKDCPDSRETIIDNSTHRVDTAYQIDSASNYALLYQANNLTIENAVLKDRNATLEKDLKKANRINIGLGILFVIGLIVYFRK